MKVKIECKMAPDLEVLREATMHCRPFRRHGVPSQMHAANDTTKLPNGTLCSGLVGTLQFSLRGHDKVAWLISCLLQHAKLISLPSCLLAIASQPKLEQLHLLTGLAGCLAGWLPTPTSQPTNDWIDKT
jgi:hypothetical protein